ncbi:MAG: hypothetical protein KAI66_07355, partial [Lentisphaeria bacterium]|nr:hypothetical protein [Lentisphaeria bacterium]
MNFPNAGCATWASEGGSKGRCVGSIGPAGKEPWGNYPTQLRVAGGAHQLAWHGAPGKTHPTLSKTSRSALTNRLETGRACVTLCHQELVHTAMLVQENPRDLTRIRFALQRIPKSGSERIVTESPPGCGMTMFERPPGAEAIRRLGARSSLH